MLAVDPGRDKCGLARVSLAGAILTRAIVPRATLEDALRPHAAEPALEMVVIGDGTTSRAALDLVRALFGEQRVAVVDERDSTYQARAIYFADNPPRGFWKLVPLGMQAPTVAIDDYAAVVLARRWLAARSTPASAP